MEHWSHTFYDRTKFALVGKARKKSSDYKNSTQMPGVNCAQMSYWTPEMWA